MKVERAWPGVTTSSVVITARERGVQVEAAPRTSSELRQWHEPDVISYSASIKDRIVPPAKTPSCYDTFPRFSEGRFEIAGRLERRTSLFSSGPPNPRKTMKIISIGTPSPTRTTMKIISTWAPYP